MWRASMLSVFLTDSSLVIKPLSILHFESNWLATFSSFWLHFSGLPSSNSSLFTFFTGLVTFSSFSLSLLFLLLPSSIISANSTCFSSLSLSNNSLCLTTLSWRSSWNVLTSSFDGTGRFSGKSNILASPLFKSNVASACERRSGKEKQWFCFGLRGSDPMSDPTMRYSTRIFSASSGFQTKTLLDWENKVTQVSAPSAILKIIFFV